MFNDVTDDNKNKLLQLKDKYKNMSITMFNMGSKFKDVPNTKGYHVNYVSAYKMLIPSMLSQYEKIIYLDTDVIVRSDLTELYNFNIGDNYIASTPVLYNIFIRKNISEILNIPDTDYYINAGVMIMNIKKIREDKIDEKWISLLGSFEGSIDQNIINKVCYSKTIFFPLKFNVCLSEMGLYRNFGNIFYSNKEINLALECPVIFHWAGKEKPWLYRNVFLAQEWLRYYLISPFCSKLINRNKTYYPMKELRKYYFLGIPFFKIEYFSNEIRIYFLKFIKILTIKKWRT